MSWFVCAAVRTQRNESYESSCESYELRVTSYELLFRRFLCLGSVFFTFRCVSVSLLLLLAVERIIAANSVNQSFTAVSRSRTQLVRTLALDESPPPPHV